MVHREYAFYHHCADLLANTDTSLDLVDPAHILINISESGLGALLPAALTDLVKHSNNYLRRVFPHGMRITSSNLNPITAAWSNGSQVAAMNWQVYDRGLELNEAMFVGSDGWVPKPAALGEPVTRKVRMKVDVKGVSASELVPSNVPCHH